MMLGKICNNYQGCCNLDQLLKLLWAVTVNSFGYGRKERCQMVNGQMVKLRKMLADRWETQILSQFQVSDKW